jgi:ribonuclease VapC
VIVDSSALIAVLEFESDARLYNRLMADAKILKLAAPTYLETAMVLSRRKTSDALVKLNDYIIEAQIELIPFGPDAAYAATQAFLRFGKGRGHPAQLNFGDCMSYAVSKIEGLPLLFKGEDFRLTDVECAI